MIISHTYKYIFAKPRKVGGTSVSLALADQWVGEGDICSLPGRVILPSGEIWRNKRTHPPHMGWGEIRGIAGKSTFDEYNKFTIVRNPWHIVGSLILGQHYHVVPETISLNWLQKMVCDLRGKPIPNTILWWADTAFNEHFYFTKDGVLEDITFLRTESLQDDFNAMPFVYGGVELEHLRKKDNPKSYKELLEDDLVNFIGEVWEKTVNEFGYTGP